MKKKFKLLNDTFIHLDNDNKGYIVHRKESKYIEWVHCGVGQQQKTFLFCRTTRFYAIISTFTCNWGCFRACLILIT